MGARCGAEERYLALVAGLHRFLHSLQSMPAHYAGCFLDLLAEEREYPKEKVYDAIAKRMGNHAQIGYLIQYFGDSDSKKARNPIYRMANRDEGVVEPQGR